jgi:hypothetical protein
MRAVGGCRWKGARPRRAAGGGGGTGERGAAAQGGRAPARPVLGVRAEGVPFDESDRSSQRYQRWLVPDEVLLRQRLRLLARRHPRYGNRRIHALLRREGWVCNRRRVQRLWRDEGCGCQRSRGDVAACAWKSRRLRLRSNGVHIAWASLRLSMTRGASLRGRHSSWHSLPSLGNRWRPTAWVFACFCRFLEPGSCDGLPSVAPAGLHRGSIRGATATMMASHTRCRSRLRHHPLCRLRQRWRATGLRHGATARRTAVRASTLFFYQEKTTQ